MYYCTKCNKPLVWQSDFDVEDVLYLEHYPEELDGVISYYYCPNCDRLETVLYSGNTMRILDIDDI